MNKSKLKHEGTKWVEDGVISDQQLTTILSRYEKKDASYLLIILATLLVSIAVLTFVFSDWAQVPHISRIIVMLVFMSGLYFLGNYFYEKKSQAYGVSLLLLAYIFFGATMFLTLMIYNVPLHSTWPFAIWSVVGLGLFALYKHPYILLVGLLVTLSGQIYSGLAFTSGDLYILAIYVLGYFHFVYHYPKVLLNYVFALGLAIQLLIVTLAFEQQYYWLILYFLVMYGLSVVINKASLKKALLSVSLLSVFIVKIAEVFMLQEDYDLDRFILSLLFIVLLAIVWLVVLNVKWFTEDKSEVIDLILFVPLFFLPGSFIFVIISMFLFSLYWLITSIKYQLSDRLLYGIIGFLLSVFTVYIQYAWEAMNKSLFFLIGGLLLFGISFIFGKQRHSIEKESDGGDEK